MKRIILTVFLVLYLTALAQGNHQIAIKGGTFYTVTNGILENGVLLIKEGKILGIGKDLEIPQDFRIFEAEGKHITPGFILSYSQVGLEGDGIARDYVEQTNPITPEMRAIDGFYPFSRTIPRLRNRGITTVATFPAPTNVISGQGAVLKLKGIIAENMALKPVAGLMISLGEKPKRTSGLPQTRMGEIYLLKKSLNDAREYLQKWEKYEKLKDKTKKPEFDFKLDPLAHLLNGRFPAFIQCYKVQDMMNAIKLAKDYGFKLVLVDANEAHKIATEIRNRNIPVMAGAFSRESELTSDIWDPRNAALLQKSGVLMSIIPGGDWPIYGIEELTFYAAYAIRHGLSEEDALKAITINPARIFGLDNRIGSLEKGKDADIAVLDSHPFRVKARVEKVFIDGEVFEIPH